MLRPDFHHRISQSEKLTLIMQPECLPQFGKSFLLACPAQNRSPTIRPHGVRGPVDH